VHFDGGWLFLLASDMPFCATMPIFSHMLFCKLVKGILLSILAILITFFSHCCCFSEYQTSLFYDFIYFYHRESVKINRKKIHFSWLHQIKFMNPMRAFTAYPSILHFLRTISVSLRGCVQFKFHESVSVSNSH
jgi:hypothetical protein